jgi:hypothetical protein
VRDRGLEAERDRRERLVDLVVQILGDAPALALLGLDRGAARLAPGGLKAREHPVDRGLEAVGLAGVDPVAGDQLVVGVGVVNRLHGGDQPVERDEAPAQEQPVAEQGGHQGEAEHEHLAPAERVADPRVEGERGHDRGPRDEEQVHGQYLKEQRAGLHDRSDRLHACAYRPAHLGSKMGSSPDIDRIRPSR